MASKLVLPASIVPTLLHMKGFSEGNIHYGTVKLRAAQDDRYRGLWQRTGYPRACRWIGILARPRGGGASVVRSEPAPRWRTSEGREVDRLSFAAEGVSVMGTRFAVLAGRRQCLGYESLVSMPCPNLHGVIPSVRRATALNDDARGADRLGVTDRCHRLSLRVGDHARSGLIGADSSRLFPAVRLAARPGFTSSGRLSAEVVHARQFGRERHARAE